MRLHWEKVRCRRSLGKDKGSRGLGQYWYSKAVAAAVSCDSKRVPELVYSDIYLIIDSAGGPKEVAKTENTRRDGKGTSSNSWGTFKLTSM